MDCKHRDIPLLAEDIIHRKTETYLDERLYFAPLRKLLRTHPLGHLQGVPLDSSNNSMRVWSVLGTLVQLLDDDDLLPCLTTCENDRDLYHQHDQSASINTELKHTIIRGV